MIEINHFAHLARLGLTEKEKKKLQRELSVILDFVDKLNEVKVDKVQPTAQVTGLVNVMREDKGREKNKTEREKLLKLAPKRQDNHFKVKTIL